MPVAGERDFRLAQELREALAHEAAPDGEGAVADTWVRFSGELREHLEVSDPREFLQWPVVRKSMFVSNPHYVAEELRYLRSRADWADRWQAGLQESPIGRPRPYPRYPRYPVLRLHHQE